MRYHTSRHDHAAPPSTHRTSTPPSLKHPATSAATKREEAPCKSPCFGPRGVSYADCPSCPRHGENAFCGGYERLFEPAPLTDASVAPARVQRIALVAERHHASTFLLERLRTVFVEGETPAHLVPQRPRGAEEVLGWVRHRHWFQPRDVRSVYADVNATLNSTLVVVLLRNVYDWSLSMLEQPHHAAAHAGRHSLTELLASNRSEWSPQPGASLGNSLGAAATARLGAPMRQTAAAASSAPFCRGNFRPGELLPCTANDNHHIYEQDSANRRPYPTLLHLWRAKMASFLDFGAYTPHLEFARMEDVIGSNESVAHWLCHLRCKYGLTRRCERGGAAGTADAHHHAPHHGGGEACCGGGGGGGGGGGAVRAAWQRSTKVGTRVAQKVSAAELELVHSIVPAELQRRMGYARLDAV